jgi:hypothetical protein
MIQSHVSYHWTTSQHKRHNKRFDCVFQDNTNQNYRLLLPVIGKGEKAYFMTPSYKTTIGNRVWKKGKWISLTAYFVDDNMAEK